MSVADGAQLASAIFTALAALAALATVYAAERERKARAIPNLHVSLVDDRLHGQVRAVIANYGGAAKDVVIMGVAGSFGFYSPIGPGAYWQAGEQRTVSVSLPPGGLPTLINVIVIGRDLDMRYVYARTAGGAARRWTIADEVSNADIWEHFFSGEPTPLGVEHGPMEVKPVNPDGSPLRS